MLPTQDCTDTYGGAIYLLEIDTLSATEFTASKGARLSPEGLLAGFSDGLHTLSDAGAFSLIDVKRFDPSPARRWIDWQRKLRRLF